MTRLSGRSVIQSMSPHDTIPFSHYCSGRKAEAVPADVWDLAAASQATEVNFSKNQLTVWPEK